MPSLQKLQAIYGKPYSSDTDDSKVIIDNYVKYFTYKAVKIAESGNTPDMVDNIHRNSAEYKLVHEILAALTAEFPDCKITLSTWGPWRSDGKFIELEDHQDPRGENHEFIVDWSSTTFPEQKQLELTESQQECLSRASKLQHVQN
jgi:hypothetical protein